jgi:hypothetical protein
MGKWEICKKDSFQKSAPILGKVCQQNLENQNNDK